MANRRYVETLRRHCTAILCSNASLKTSPPLLQRLPTHHPLQTLSPPTRAHISTTFFPRHFSSHHNHTEDDEDEDEDEDEDDGDEDEDEEEDEDVCGGGTHTERVYTAEEKEEESAAIGYKVIGPLQRSDRVYKPYEPVFAVVQIGSHQFKVSNGDCLYTERLKHCLVNDKLILNKVLMLGSGTRTIIGRPILPEAAVHAIVEEHALDAKVIIFKKKRRKNYRRTKGHRQELTKLRITDIEGIEKPEITEPTKTEKAAVKKAENVAVAA